MFYKRKGLKYINKLMKVIFKMLTQSIYLNFKKLPEKKTN